MRDFDRLTDQDLISSLQIDLKASREWASELVKRGWKLVYEHNNGYVIPMISHICKEERIYPNGRA